MVSRTLVVLGVAALVVAAWLVMGSGLRMSTSPLPDGVGLERGNGPGSGAGPVALSTSAGGLESPPGPKHFTATVEDFSTQRLERGPVGEAIQGMIRKTQGRDISTMDLTFAREEIFRILQSWRADPDRKEEDIQFFLKTWETFDDDGVRLGLSYLFRHIPDDRLVEPVMDLVMSYPWQAVDTLAAIGTPKAFEHISRAYDAMPEPEQRAQASLRLASSSWPKAVPLLKSIWEDPGRTDLERYVALEALGRRQEDPESRMMAYQVAMGESVPLYDLRERNATTPVRDLRSAGVMALMAAGDAKLVLKLLDAADKPGADPDLVRIVDHSIGAFAGADISRVLFERIGRRGKVTRGEAHYLAQHATPNDLSALEGMMNRCEDSSSRQILLGAVRSLRRQ